MPEPLTTNTEREKALLRPIDGPFPEFGQEVRRLLGYYPEDRRSFLTSRMVSRKTGVNYSTISSMVRGVRASESTIRKIASVLGGDANKLLRLAGYDVASPEDNDPLSRIGPDVDISPISSIRFSPFFASAGSGFLVHESSADYDTLESILPGQVRAIRVTGDCMQPLYNDGGRCVCAGAGKRGERKQGGRPSGRRQPELQGLPNKRGKLPRAKERRRTHPGQSLHYYRCDCRCVPPRRLS